MKKMIIRVIGKVHEAWQKEAIQMYMKRLQPLVDMEIIELSEGHSGSAKPNIVQAQEKEGESLLKSIPDNAVVIALDETGKKMSSKAFADKAGEWSQNGETLVFLIGGSWGLSDEVRSRADHVLSFGEMTLPHILARITLLEQLYRSEMIGRGKEYHK